jgi:ABC-type glycerol-3-phosphate transport system permease component
MASETSKHRQSDVTGGRFSDYFDRDRWLDKDMSIKRAFLVYGLLLLYFIWFLVPIIWFALSSIKVADIMRADQLIIIPTLKHLTLSNYQRVLTDPKFLSLFVNSAIITTSTVVLTLVLGTLGAYSLSRFTYPGRNALLLGFLSTKMLPAVLIIVPFFVMMYSYNLVNTYIGIILAHSIKALPLALWLLKGFFDDIPKALDEAARIDGCSYLQVLTRIIIPLSLPGIAVAGFYTFVTSWNDFLFVSVLSRSSGTRTLPFGLYLYQSQTSVDWGATITVAILTIIPPLVLFALVQNEILEGLASGGMHGE